MQSAWGRISGCNLERPGFPRVQLSEEGRAVECGQVQRSGVCSGVGSAAKHERDREREEWNG